MCNRNLSSFPSHGAGVVVRGHGWKASTLAPAGGPEAISQESTLQKTMRAPIEVMEALTGALTTSVCLSWWTFYPEVPIPLAVCPLMSPIFPVRSPAGRADPTPRLRHVWHVGLASRSTRSRTRAARSQCGDTTRATERRVTATYDDPLRPRLGLDGSDAFSGV